MIAVTGQVSRIIRKGISRNQKGDRIEISKGTDPTKHGITMGASNKVSPDDLFLQ